MQQGLMRSARVPCAPRPSSLGVAPRPLRSSSRGLAVRPRAAQKENDVVDDQINEYCAIDASGKKAPKKSLGEMEAEFLDALRSFYYDGQPAMNNEEFDMLKEELIWQGSKVAVLSSDEQRFMEASLAYAAGNSFLTDAQYDELKVRLKQQGSSITAQGPRCSLRSRKMYSDSQPDYLRMTLLNVPAAFLVLGALFGVDYATGFKITALVELPEPYGIIALWGLVLPTALVFATAITNLVFKDFVILTAPCPSCGTDNLSYFGEILTVAGNRGQATCTCANPDCKSKLVFDEVTRMVNIEEPAAPPPAKVPANV